MAEINGNNKSAAEISESYKRAAVACAEKHDVNQAARKFGVSVQSLEKWIAETKTDSESTEAPKPKRKNHRYSEVLKQEVIQYAKDHSQQAAALRYKVTTSTVSNWCIADKMKEMSKHDNRIIAALEEKLKAAEAECEKYREMIRIAKELSE
jgi:transposase-like protein